MRFLPVALLALILPQAEPSPARGQVVAPSLASATPSDANYKAHPEWNKECEDRVAAMKGKPCDIMFIGDSITQNFVEEPKGGWNLVGKSVWDKHYTNRNALNFGVGADATQHVLWRLDHMDVKEFNPKVAVILIGTNNTKDTPQDIANGVKAVIRKTEAVFPGAKIILLGILPTTRESVRMADANKIIQTFGDNERVFYFDLGARMTPMNGNWKGVGHDHLHLTPEGYELWASSMEPLLTRLVASRF